MISNVEPSSEPIRPGHTGRQLVVVGVAIAVVLGVFGTVVYAETRIQGPTLTIYTYSSLFGGAYCGAPAWSTVFDGFGKAHGVHVQVSCPAGTLYSTLASQANAPGADLVIGLDEITARQADARGLLVPYSSPALADVPPEIVSALSPDHAVTPYEYGYLAFDYNPAFASLVRSALANASMLEFAQNRSWASHLTVEDAFDITGEEFLLWEIAFYTNVLHQNWTNFWTAVDPVVTTADTWSDGYNNFTNGAVAQALVSYATDPAAGIAFNETWLKAFIGAYNGIVYGWQTLYGIGIVRGSAHEALDREFIDWFLSGTVQEQIPTTEWEYPANETIGLPSVFNASIPPATIQPLNGAFTSVDYVNMLPGWLSEWQAIASTV